MPFKPGQSGNVKGKPKGAVTLITRTVREIVLETFLELQNDPKHNFKAFCKNFPREGMAICAKLIPSDVRAELTIPEGIKVIYQHDTDSKPIGTNPEDHISIQG